jgi:hypothetical protein
MFFFIPRFRTRVYRSCRPRPPVEKVGGWMYATGAFLVLVCIVAPHNVWLAIPIALAGVGCGIRAARREPVEPPVYAAPPPPPLNERMWHSDRR